MKVSLVISVYKNTEALKVVLDGLRFQSYQNFEVVITEDGESDAMASFVSQYNQTRPLLHLTQPDEGWRKNKALNNAIRKCSGDYLIFIDGDCVLHHAFIENHIRLATPKGIVAGKRVKLGPGYSQRLMDNITVLPALQKGFIREFNKMRSDGVKFYEEGFYFDPAGLLSFIPKLRTMNRLKGCNMSFYRSAIEAINGFDEDYKLPAVGEDADLTWRFKGLGYHLVSARNLAVQYHLHHKENWTDQSENRLLMESKMKSSMFVCKNGLRKL
jgi:cellulose synthase/poly-beta-1,6-N-acetylglucosamine synthase-like glycosyltransferase